jgi:hypothetical protein
MHKFTRFGGFFISSLLWGTPRRLAVAQNPLDVADSLAPNPAFSLISCQAIYLLFLTFVFYP